MIIFYFIVNALVILGVHFCFQNGQILGFIGDLARDRPQFRLIFKPTILCFVCMSSVWGTLGYWIHVGNYYDAWIIYILSLTGFMYLIKLTFFE